MGRLALIVCVGCGRINFDPRGDGPGVVMPPDSACAFGPWQPAVPLLGVNSSGDDWGMWLSQDRTELIFSSARTGNYELYRATRTSATAQWSAPAPYYQSPDYDDNPFISEDGMLWFSNDATGDFELRVAPRATPAANQIVLSAPTASDEAPSLTLDGLTLYYDSNRDFYRATRATVTDMFTTAIRIDELSSPVFDCCASIAADGTFVFVSDGFGNVRRSIMMSRWTGSAFTPPTLLDTGYDVTDAFITPDGLTLLFAALTTTNANDIYSMDRTCQ